MCRVASEIEDDFSGPPEPGIHSGPVTPESNSGTGKVRIPAKSALFPVQLSDIPYSCLTEKLVTLVDSVSFIFFLFLFFLFLLSRTFADLITFNNNYIIYTIYTICIHDYIIFM